MGTHWSGGNEKGRFAPKQIKPKKPKEKKK